MSRAELLAAPEMSTQFDGEVEVERYGADEGQGTGFDDLDMSAHVYRVIVPSRGWSDLREQTPAAFGSLGWREVRNETEWLLFERDPGERLQVQLLPEQGALTSRYSRPGPFVRISLTVASARP